MPADQLDELKSQLERVELEATILRSRVRSAKEQRLGELPQKKATDMSPDEIRDLERILRCREVNRARRSDAISSGATPLMSR